MFSSSASRCVSGNASCHGQIGPHGVHELVRDQERQVELSQSTVLALRAHEIHRVGMADVERSHLRAAPPACRRDGKAHLVVDIHERQRARRVRARAAHVSAARSQRREFVADAAACFQRQTGFMDLVQDVVHRVADRARDRAIDRRCRRLVILGAGVRSDSPGRNGAPLQRPQKPVVPLPSPRRFLNGRERFRDALVGAVDVAIDRLASLRLQAVLRVPNI